MSSQDIELKELLKELNDGTIQLPDFQRDWVWDNNRIKALIISLANNYPVGAVMFLNTGGEIKFSYRPFTGVNTQVNTPKSLALDGQQRLTSILNAMYLKSAVQTRTEQNKPIKRFYYFNLTEISNSTIDWDVAIESVNENKQITSNFGKDIDLDLSASELEYKNNYIPVNILFDETQYSKWKDEYFEYYKSSADFMKHLNYIQTFERKIRNKPSFKQ